MRIIFPLVTRVEESFENIDRKLSGPRQNIYKMVMLEQADPRGILWSADPGPVEGGEHNNTPAKKRCWKSLEKKKKKKKKTSLNGRWRPPQELLLSRRHPSLPNGPFAGCCMVARWCVEGGSIDRHHGNRVCPVLRHSTGALTGKVEGYLVIEEVESGESPTKRGDHAWGPCLGTNGSWRKGGGGPSL